MCTDYMSAPEFDAKVSTHVPTGILRAHSVKVIKSLPKHRTTDSVSQTRLKNKIFSSSLHELPTKIDLPIKHHKTIILSSIQKPSMFERCRNYVLKPTVQKPTKSWKGSRFNNKASDQIRWLPITSIDAPQISARIHPLLTQLPRDAPHRSTHQTFIPLSPIWLHSRLSFMMVLLMRKASAKAWKRWKASRWLMDDSWQNRTQRLLFQKAFHLHWKLKDRIEVQKQFLLRTNGVQAKKTLINPKLEVTCDASTSQKKDIMCTNMCRLQGVSVSVYPCVSGISCIVAQHKIIESLPKQKTKYSGSQGTLSKTILSSLHDLPTKIAFPTKLSPLPCSGTMSSSHAAKLSKSLLNPEKVQGSTIKPLIKSCDFPSLPLMLHRS